LTHNGALIKYAESLETVDVALIETYTTKEILRVGRHFGSDALVSTDPRGKGTLLYETVSEDNIPLQKYIVWSKHLHGDEAEDALHHVPNLEDNLIGNEIIHISYSGTCQPMEQLKIVLDRELDTTVNIQATIYPHLDFTLLDILPPATSKATGLDKLVKLNDLTPAEVMVIGDNFNDLEMLEYAGTSVIMGNADESLRERKEFYTTLDNNKSGVAAAINKFISGEKNG
jgi:hydroxymethylpyrimidine pyrophosphatase-like HAD family hydrolase